MSYGRTVQILHVRVKFRMFDTYIPMHKLRVELELRIMGWEDKSQLNKLRRQVFRREK